MAKYSEEKAQDYLYASALAYCPAEKVMAGQCKAATVKAEALGIKPIFSLDNDNFDDPVTMTFMARKSKKELIIGFSGTKGARELIDEIEHVIPTSYDIHPSEGSKVFGFFYQHYMQDFRSVFLQKLKEFVNSRNYKGYTIVFTGHSLGGAITVHAAADAILSELLTGRDVVMYTYGQPRVGNIQFLNQFDSRFMDHFRVVHNKDLVPHVPPCITNLDHGCLKDGTFPIFPYHAPTEVFYTEEMDSFKVCSSGEGEDNTCSDSIFSDSIDDHTHYFGVHVGQFHNQDMSLKEVLEAIK